MIRDEGDTLAEWLCVSSSGDQRSRIGAAFTGRSREPSGLQLALDGANTHGRDCRDGNKQCRDHGEQDDARTTGERQLGEGLHVPDRRRLGSGITGDQIKIAQIGERDGSVSIDRNGGTRTKFS